MEIIRCVSVKATLEDSGYRDVMEVASEAAAYGNRTMRALWAEAVGLKVDASVETRDVQKHVRRFEKGNLRLNDGNVKRHTTKRLESLVSGVRNRRLTYRELIQK